MKKILYISLVIMLYAVQPCLAQDIERQQETCIAGNDTAANVLPYAGDNALYLPGDTAFFPRLYNPMPYYTGSWQLHSGLNAQLGTSVTVGFGKHSPRGVGIGTHAAFLYAASLTPKLSLAGGISSETLDWGGIKLRNAELREIFHGSVRPAKTSALPVAFPWLNTSQQEAVNEALWAKDVAIIHGPPGTGKTTTLVETVYEILRRENQVLVCAQSNMAVDWISEKISDRGINVLRIGNPTRVNDKMLSFTYERRFESHPDYPQLWALRRTIRQLYSQKGDTEKRHQKIDRLRDRATEIELSIHNYLLTSARVIACTLAGAANRILDGQHYHTLVVDEAAQALEAAVWIPLQKADRLILAGDHRQLPPTIKSREAMKAGLGQTLMQTVATERPECVSLLKVQYRMNDDIARFSSQMFYGGEIVSAPEVKNRSILDFDTPITWIDTSGNDFHENFIGETYGRINPAEAELTINTLKNYINEIGKHRMLEENLDIGIISPYKAQVQLLRRMFRQDSFFKPFKNLVSVNTVDGFQGQERDIIVISLVRANEEGEIGFLSDIRRMNVAMTRARMKLFILGNPDTLLRHDFYRKLYEYVESLKPHQ